MTKAIPTTQPGGQPDNRPANSGEGAQTALAALIRKRRMGENHVEHEPEDRPTQSTPDA